MSRESAWLGVGLEFERGRSSHSAHACVKAESRDEKIELLENLQRLPVPPLPATMRKYHQQTEKPRLCRHRLVHNVAHWLRFFGQLQL